jgi:hypothetical protein
MSLWSGDMKRSFTVIGSGVAGRFRLEMRHRQLEKNTSPEPKIPVIQHLNG